MEHSVRSLEEILHAWKQLIVHLPAPLLAGHKPAIPQAAQVCRCVRLRQPGRLDDVTDAARTVAQVLEDRQPASVSEAPQEGKALLHARTMHTSHELCKISDVSLWRRQLRIGSRGRAVHSGPCVATIKPMPNVELERVEVLELLGMVLAHLNDAEARREMSARVPMLMGIRDRLAASLREDR